MKIVKHLVKSGTYRALTGGYGSRVVIDGYSFVLNFSKGVRGVNLDDTITVNAEKNIYTSALLGEAYNVYLVIKE